MASKRRFLRFGMLALAIKFLELRKTVDKMLTQGMDMVRKSHGELKVSGFNIPIGCILPAISVCLPAKFQGWACPAAGAACPSVEPTAELFGSNEGGLVAWVKNVSFPFYRCVFAFSGICEISC